VIRKKVKYGMSEIRNRGSEQRVSGIERGRGRDGRKILRE
jgi:hypothetical protein